MSKQYCVGAVEKAIKILNYLAEYPYSSFSEIYTALEFSKSTTYQTLSTLEMYHYIVRLENKRYCLDISLLTLLQGIPMRNNLLECIRPALTKLAEETGFTVHFCTLTENNAICIFKIDGVNFTIHTTAVGRPLTLHTSAAGKALMAWLPEKQREKYISAIEYTAFTKHSITSPEIYKKELDLTKKRGFSIDNEEGANGAFGIGVPVFSKDGTIQGAISIGAIVTELTNASYEQIAKRMYETAHLISQNFDISLD